MWRQATALLLVLYSADLNEDAIRMHRVGRVRRPARGHAGREPPATPGSSGRGQGLYVVMEAGKMVAAFRVFEEPAEAVVEKATLSLIPDGEFAEQ